jgi:hypothetical protein
MSYQLTKEVKKRLAEFAAKITDPNYVPGAPGAPISADELRAKGITTDGKGYPISDAKVYYAAALPAVNHHRRLQSAYAVGGWPRVEAYLLPFLTPEGYARQQAEAAAPGAPAEQAWLDESGTVPPAVQLASAGVPGYENAIATGEAGPSLMAEFFSAGLEGPISPEAECLIAQSVAAVDAQLSAILPVLIEHRPGAAPGEPSCEPRLPYDAQGATRRLQLAYEAGVAVPGELYAAHQEVQEAPRSLCASDNAGNCLVCLQAGPGCITADFVPRFSCDCGRTAA